MNHYSPSFQIEWNLKRIKEAKPYVAELNDAIKALLNLFDKIEAGIFEKRESSNLLSDIITDAIRIGLQTFGQDIMIEVFNTLVQEDKKYGRKSRTIALI